MSDYLEPANTNLSFSDVMTDKKRQLAEDTLGPVVHTLCEAGIPSDRIGEVLFSLLKSILLPKGELTGDKAAIWYAQLLRFRDELSTHIDMIEDALDS